MDAALFRQFCDLAQRHAGIALDDRREAFVSARVDKRVRALGLRDIPEYLRLLETDRSGDEFARLLTSLADRPARFFREPEHFRSLADAVRAWYAGGQRRFRVWTAASGTGEEAYSVAITVLDALDGREADVRVLATDLSSRNLRVASEGAYEEPSVAALDRALRSRWFETVGRRGPRDARLVRVKPALRDLIVFKRLNLAAPPFPMRGPLDAVYCRDVLPYLERPTRERVLVELDRLLRPDGLLFLGPTESLSGSRGRLAAVAPSVYRRIAPLETGVRAQV